ncbi:MAG: DUF5058 family protein [Acutalibacteraceae bacterium]
MDFREDSFMLILGLIVVLAISVQSVFFLIRAIRRGREIGVSSLVIKNTVISSVLFTLAPSLAIVATVVALSPSLGIILPWIRLSVIGNITQETTAASTALASVGDGSSLSFAVTDKGTFNVVMWVMALASSFPLLIIPLMLKRLQKGIKKFSGNKDSKWTDAMSASAFLGLISAFIARSIAGVGTFNSVSGQYNYDGAGLISAAALVSSIIAMIILQKIALRYKIKWLDSFAMPMSMLLAMGVVIVLAQILPESLYQLEWRMPQPTVG